MSHLGEGAEVRGIGQQPVGERPEGVGIASEPEERNGTN